MKYRNAKYLKNGWIDCEIEHPRHGWIPFTCNPEDKSATFDTKELFDRMVSSNNVAAFIPPTQEELNEEQMIIVRAKRNRLLSQSDILVFPDRWISYTPEKQAAISQYRQALRDLPENITDPFNVTWPTKPE
jgi:hypothetical protein